MSVKCAQCGDECPDKVIHSDDHYFCCVGCQTAFHWMKDLKFSQELQPQNAIQFEALKDQEFREEFLLLETSDTLRYQFYIPNIHCSSCIWVLEKLPEINEEIIASEVNFQSRTIQLTITPKADLYEIACFLNKLGYPPDISPNDHQSKNHFKSDILKIGVAGFSFGNIMLFAFPDYLGYDIGTQFQTFFNYISLALATLTLLYCGKYYYQSAFHSLKLKRPDVNIPIALGLSMIYIFSLYQVFINHGEVYFDSLTGLLFFLLIGRYFQNKTLHVFFNEKDIQAYFPPVVLKQENEALNLIKTKALIPGDVIFIRKGEIIPVKGELLSESVLIDNTFINGESDEVFYQQNANLFAGGKVVSDGAYIKVLKAFDISFWKNQWYAGKDNQESNHITNRYTKYFTPIILSIAIISFFYWLTYSFNDAFTVAVSVLIVACPCAFALAEPIVSTLSKHQLSSVHFFIKNYHAFSSSTSKLQFVFDKTGTLTHGQQINFIENHLNSEEISLIKSICQHSTHPVSQILYRHIDGETVSLSEQPKEIQGQGISYKDWKIGSFSFCFDSSEKKSGTYISHQGQVKAHFQTEEKIDPSLVKAIQSLQESHEVYLCTGDNIDKAQVISRQLGISEAHVKYNQLPKEKADFIQSLKSNGATVMIGDGLNDSGAMDIADIAISVTSENASFFPKCDALIYQKELHQIESIFNYITANKRLLNWIVSVAFMYNLVGMYFALTGVLSPLIASILMPVSSLSVLILGQVGTKSNFKKIS